MKISLAKSFTVLFLLWGAAAVAFGQSGRIKPLETPSPTPTPKPNIVYTTTDKSQPKPSPTPPKTGDEEVIKVESNLVPIAVAVFDKSGIPITNLRPDDFILQIDGSTAEIGEMTRSQSPVRLALLFDNSSSVSIAREFEKKTAIKFLESVIRPEKDLASLFSVSTVSRLEQPLTKDVGLIVSAIESFPAPVGLTSLLDGFVRSADYLGGASGRRVVVVVSDGEDTGSEASLEEAVRALQMASVQVFVVKTTDFENFKRTQTREGSANLKQLTAERRMQEIVKQTGGAVYSPLDDFELEQAFAKITNEISDQYLISFYPCDDVDRTVKFRSIKIAVRNRPDITVRTRVGYYGPR